MIIIKNTLLHAILIILLRGKIVNYFSKKVFFIPFFIFYPYDCPNVRAISTSYIDNEKITQAPGAYVNSIAY